MSLVIFPIFSKICCFVLLLLTMVTTDGKLRMDKNLFQILG